MTLTKARVVRCATRGSLLALTQTRWALARAKEACPGLDFEETVITTKGDRVTDRPLAEVGGVGVFVKEIEAALVDGRADLAVHSMKDMPSRPAGGLVIAAVPKREDARDVLVSRTGQKLMELPKGARVGTSSLRRVAQLRMVRPDLEYVPIRGNLDTRLRKLETGEYDAIVVAAAGMVRLGWSERITEYLDVDTCVPACGQGALCIETRKDDGLLIDALKGVEDPATRLAVAAERGFLAAIDGGCKVPCGAYAEISDDGILTIRGMLAKAADGLGLVVRDVMSSMVFSEGQASALGAELGRRLLGSVGSLVVRSPAGGADGRLVMERPLRDSAAGPAEARAGKLYLIGAGPGDPGLITVKGARCIEKADVVIYDRLASPRLLEHARPDAELIYVGKAPGAHALSQEEISELCVRKALEGKIVARLKGGDPFVFGRGGEEAHLARRRGVPYEIVPGITSATAVPAYAGIPVTHRGVAASFAVITGHEAATKPGSQINWEGLAKGPDTLVFLMGMENLGEICRQLIANGRPSSTPAAVIEWGTTPRQRTVTGVLEDIHLKVEEAGLSNPAVIIVGDVVRLREDLAWLESMPLFGWRVVVTRSRHQASALVSAFEDLGASCIEFPVIKIEPPDSFDGLDDAIRRLHDFDWVVFTSANGVSAFFGRLAALGADVRRLSKARIAAIGRETARALAERGLVCDVVPEKYVAEDLARAMIDFAAAGHASLSGARVLLPRAASARDVLVDMLSEVGAEVLEVAAYKTAMDGDGMAEEVARALSKGEAHIVTFTSSSTVHNFAALIGKERAKDLLKDAVVACIGPITANTAREYGIEPTVVAEDHTIAGLVSAVVDHISRNPQAALRLQNPAVQER